MLPTATIRGGLRHYLRTTGQCRRHRLRPYGSQHVVCLLIRWGRSYRPGTTKVSKIYRSGHLYDGANIQAEAEAQGEFHPQLPPLHLTIDPRFVHRCCGAPSSLRILPCYVRTLTDQPEHGSAISPTAPRQPISRASPTSNDTSLRCMA